MLWRLGWLSSRQLVIFGNETCLVKVVKTPKPSFEHNVGHKRCRMHDPGKGREISVFICCFGNISILVRLTSPSKQVWAEETASVWIPVDHKDDVVCVINLEHISFALSGLQDHFILYNSPSVLQITTRRQLLLAQSSVSIFLGLARTESLRLLGTSGRSRF